MTSTFNFLIWPVQKMNGSRIMRVHNHKQNQVATPTEAVEIPDVVSLA